MSNPLWMPKGSVHALFAAGVLAVSGYMVVNGMEVPQWWQALTIGALGGYSFYRHRAKDEPGAQESPINLHEHDLLMRGDD